MRKLSFVLLAALFTGCACTDAEHSMVIQGDKRYRVKKGSIVHKDNGCITFSYKEFEESDNPGIQIEMCGSYTIQN